jgi:hypothetical protein
MVVGPLSAPSLVTVFQVPVVPPIKPVTRAARAAEADADVTGEERERDIKDGRPRRRAPRVSASSSPAARSSPGVLSALIDLQERAGG